MVKAHELPQRQRRRRESPPAGGTKVVCRPEDPSLADSEPLDVTLYIKPACGQLRCEELLRISGLSLQRLSEGEVNGTVAGFILFYF